TSSKRDWSSDVCSSDLMNKQYHPIRTWIGNVIRFELLYRLFVILIVYPLSNALINLYITTNTVHTSLSNFSMFFDFLSIPGILEIGRASCRERGTLMGA